MVVDFLAALISVYGCWFEGGRLIVGRRLSGVARWTVAAAIGTLAWGLLVTALIVSGIGNLAPPLSLAVGVGLSLRRLWRLRKGVPAPKVDQLVLVLCGLLAAGVAVAIVYPSLLVQGGEMVLTAYYAADGLWFGGSAAALEQGFPPPDYRLVETPLHYHFLSLSVGHGVAGLFGWRHAVVFFYILIPLWAGLCAILGGAAVTAITGTKNSIWVGLGALSATYLCDAGSLLLFLGSDKPALWEYLHTPPALRFLGNPTRISQLVNPPQALSLVFALSAVLLWVGQTQKRSRLSTVSLVGFLILGAGLSKGVAIPLILPGLMAAVGLVGLSWLRGQRRNKSGHEPLWARARTSLVLLAWSAFAFVLLMVLYSASDTSRLLVHPWYHADYLANASQALTRWHDALPVDSRIWVLVLWVVPALCWLLFAAVPLQQRRARAAQGVLWVGQLAGFVVANVFAFEHFSGSNEIYFATFLLGVLPPFAVAGAYRATRKTTATLKPRVAWSLVAVLFGVGLFGTSHLLISHRVGTPSFERTLPAEQLQVIDWLRTQTPPDAVVLNFRFTTIDDDPRQMAIPLNESYFLVSGLAERQVVSEGSLFNTLYLRPGFAALREQITSFYAGQMSPLEAVRWLSGLGVTYVLGERGIDLSMYERVIAPVEFNPRFQIYQVRDRLDR